MAGRYDIRVDIGATFRSTFTRKVNGVVIDPSLSRWKLSLRDDLRQQWWTYELSTVGDDVIIEILPSITAQFKPHRHYHYILDRIDSPTEVARALQGSVIAR